jgi:serine/threonine-protein kinase
VLLPEAEGESAHVVKPKSDAMPAPEQTGTRYQLQGEIARGGMGAVLRGRDVDLGRDLAVKVLLEKHADRPEVVRRFIEEAQIGGQLQHPGVVPVYDIGRFGDRPFFTMKLVKGQTLAALLSQRQQPLEDLPQLLGIALKVSQALAYAHAKGVIHRDLKPANIMVGAFGEVQVMDWGLAKVLAEGGSADEDKAIREQQRPEDGTVIRTSQSGSAGSGTDTEAGTLLGTPAYMPPEQANGDVALIDRRADVFGLGAILYEILTGQPPYVGRSPEEVRRKAANGDLADALSRLAGCGADAELLELTRSCLAPEASDRPKDAQAVADALTAYLDGVQARLHRAELAEAEAKARVAEEAKRRKLTLALAAMVLLAVTLGGGGWLWVKIDRDARRTQVTRQVHDALNRVTALREQAKAGPVEGGALFGQAREQAQRAVALVENGPADQELRAEVQQVQADLDEEEKDRQLLAALDAARLAQAETVAGENRFANERAVPLFREAFAAYGLAAGEGEPAATAARLRQRPEAVRQAAAAALQEWADLVANPKLELVEPHLDWLRAVVTATEPDQGWTRELRAALAEKDLAKCRAALEKLAREADLEKVPVSTLTRLAARLQVLQAPASAVALLRRAQQGYPADFWVNHHLGLALQALPGEAEEAVRYLTAAVALRPDSPGAHHNLGVALKAKGQLDEAIACYRQAIEIDPKYATAHTNLGYALKAKGQLEEAITCYRTATALDPKLAIAHNNLGNALKAKGQLEEAIACYRQAIALDPKLAVHANLGAALKAKGQLEEAIACYRQAIEINPKDASAHNNLGHALQAKGQVEEAIACYRQAIALDPNYVFAHNNLGAILCDVKHDHDGAVTCFRKVIALDPNDAIAHTNLGNALQAKGQREQAIACYRQAIALDPKYAQAHCNLGGALRSQGHFAESLAAYQRGHELGTKQPRWRYPSAAWVQNAERLAALEAKLPAFRQGKFEPADTAERLGLATVCRARQLYHATARLYAAAFAADPRLGDNLNAAHRYSAACSAALAAAGQGEDAAKLDEKERTRLRQQALDFLRADLALRQKQLQSSKPGEADTARAALRHWQQDADLAGIRDEAALAKLPAQEREACSRLWADVAALLEPKDSTTPKEPKR